VKYDDVLAYLDRVWIKHRFTKPVTDYPFDRLEALLGAFGHPERCRAFVHVTGSKGKGSMARMTSDILRAHGLRVGLFTSPHLLRVEERIDLDGAPISAESFADDFTRALRLLRETEQEGLGISPLLLAMAFDRFVREGCEVAVVEVRAGGRYDPTNIVRAQTCLLGPVALEHVPGLGYTLTDVAWQKIGIVKPGSTAFSARQCPRVTALFRSEAEAIGARLEFEGEALGARVLSADPYGQTIRLWTPDLAARQLRLNMLGAHQARNAALATSAAGDVLKRLERSLEPAALERALRETRWPGRVERLRSEPLLLFDGAHTYGSALALRTALRAHFPGERWTFVVGVIRGKRPDSILRALAPVAARVLAVPVEGFAHEPPERLAELAREIGLPAFASRSAAAALELAERSSEPVCVTGSLYLYRDAVTHAALVGTG
jgi:dihydrofolate synthase/folylpolyglutamate synthase